MRVRRRVGSHLLAGVVGVVLAHTLDYAVAFPHSHARGEHLAATGHAYWPVATGLAVLAGCAVMAMAVRLGARRALVPSPPVRFARVSWRWLALSQLGLFSGVEVLERLAAGAPVADLGQGALFPVGLALQVVVALLLCKLLEGAAALAERAASRLRDRSTFERVVRAPWPAQARERPRLVPAGRQGPRAPPPLVST